MEWFKKQAKYKKTNTNNKKKENDLKKAYRLVYKDLCQKHPHVMSLYNGTLCNDDILPRSYQVGELIEYIVQQGK